MHECQRNDDDDHPRFLLNIHMYSTLTHAAMLTVPIMLAALEPCCCWLFRYFNFSLSVVVVRQCVLRTSARAHRKWMKAKAFFSCVNVLRYLLVLLFLFLSFLSLVSCFFLVVAFCVTFLFPLKCYFLLLLWLMCVCALHSSTRSTIRYHIFLIDQITRNGAASNVSGSEFFSLLYMIFRMYVSSSNSNQQKRKFSMRKSLLHDGCSVVC